MQRKAGLSIALYLKLPFFLLIGKHLSSSGLVGDWSEPFAPPLRQGGFARPRRGSGRFDQRMLRRPFGYYADLASATKGIHRSSNPRLTLGVRLLLR